MQVIEDIKFIADRYRPGRFNADKGWSRLGIGISFKWKRFRMAAAIAGFLFLSASAAFVYNRYYSSASDNMEVVNSQEIQESPVLIVRVIDFEDTPLPIVIDKIKEMYGVDISNIPSNVNDFRLSLHYEGNANDLIETINDILGTDMTVIE